MLRAPIFILQCYGRRHLPSDTNPDRNIRQPLRSKRKIMSSIVTNMGPLRRLLPIGSRLGTLVRRAARRGEMGRDHLLNEARAWPYQDQRMYYPWHHLPCQRGWLRGKGRPNTFKGLSWPLFFLLSPIYNPWSPLIYKREGRAPH